MVGKIRGQDKWTDVSPRKMIENRKSILERLLWLEGPLDEIVNHLSAHEWDSEQLVALEKQHIINALQRYIAGEIDGITVECWANSIEIRDDIAFSQCGAKVIEDTLYELANPDLTEKLTPERAKWLIRRLAHDLQAVK